MSTSAPITESETATLFEAYRGFDKLALAVSGGADSVALMWLAARWRSHDRANCPEISILTVDHALRSGSADEARWVASLAKKLGLDHTALTWNHDGSPKRIQEQARQARYDLLARHCRENGICHLATAHHLDDQAETLLMRLARGSGVDGLAAIPRHTRWAGISISRPLLDLPKERLIDTLVAANEEWLDDPTNQSPRYERNRVRCAMQDLRRLGFDAQSLARTAKRMRRAQEALESVTDDYLRRSFTVHKPGYCTSEFAGFRAVPEEIAVRGLRRALMAIGGKIEPPRLVKLERLVERLLSGKPVDSTLAGCRISLLDPTIEIVREKGRHGFPEVILTPGCEGLWDRRFEVSISSDATRPFRVQALGRRGFTALCREFALESPPPKRVGDGLVSFWSGEHLVSVPHLDLHADIGKPELGVKPENRPICRAEFIYDEALGGTSAMRSHGVG